MSKNYILAPYVTIGLTSNSLKLGFGSIQTEILDTNIINPIIDLCKYLLEPKKFDEIKLFLSNYKNLYDKDIQYIITVLIEKHLLLEFELYNRCDRYSRQLLFYNMYSDDPIGIHKRIKKSKIIICGCGGIGSNIAVMLATMGVNDLILIDDDVIEESNLSRQFMYCENDLGLYKVDVLERELLKRDSTLKIQSIKLKFDESIEYIGTADLIVLSGDSFGICKEINSFSYKTNIPFINIGYVMDIAVWGPLVIPGKTACYECFSKQNISDKNWLSYDLMEKIKIINSRFQVPSIGPINSMSLSYAALDIMKYLGAFGSVESINNRVGIWTDNMKIQLQKYSYSDNCSLKCIDFIKLKK